MSSGYAQNCAHAKTHCAKFERANAQSLRFKCPWHRNEPNVKLGTETRFLRMSCCNKSGFRNPENCWAVTLRFRSTVPNLHPIWALLFHWWCALLSRLLSGSITFLILLMPGIKIKISDRNSGLTFSIFSRLKVSEDFYEDLMPITII